MNIIYSTNKKKRDNSWTNICKTPYECFEMIWDIGCDYDGQCSPKGLKSVIDDLVDLASRGKQLTREGSDENG